jgi:hypothetical protein
LVLRHSARQPTDRNIMIRDTAGFVDNIEIVPVVHLENTTQA